MAGTGTGKNGVAPEEVVRQYLLFLEDPTKLRDEKKIAAAKAAVTKAGDDVIKRAVAMSALERANVVNEDPYREAFVKVGKEWADSADVSWSVLKDLKVSIDVLRDAGFDVPSKAKGGRTGSGGTRQRAPGVKAEDIQAWLVRQAESNGGSFTFKMRDVTEGIGGATGTIKNAIKALKAEDLGPDKNHSGKGAAPNVYSIKV